MICDVHFIIFLFFFLFLSYKYIKIDFYLFILIERTNKHSVYTNCTKNALKSWNVCNNFFFFFNSQLFARNGDVRWHVFITAACCYCCSDKD
jgi:hypothetical protein